MIDETKRIVEWLRECAADIEAQAGDPGHILAARDALDEAADAIERGDHLKDKTE